MQNGLTVCLRELKRELKAIRERGYAESEAEITPDLWGVAAPIFRGTMADAALVLLAPAHRVNRVERVRLRSAVRTAARAISDEISFEPV
jgi:DNA-binding IclR family transcriptional regulator